MRRHSGGSRAFAIMALLWGASALASGPVGRWATTVEGERRVLTLTDGGQGDLEGEALAWRAEGAAVTLIIDGEPQRGRIAGDRLSVGSFSFTRLGRTSRTQGATRKAPSPPAAPEETPAVPGRRHPVPELGVSYVLPEGWTAGWKEQQGDRVYVLQPAGRQETAQLTLATTPLSAADQHRSTESLLEELGTQLGQSLLQQGTGMSLTPAGETKEFKAPSGRAVRRLYAVELPGEGAAEFYLGGIKHGAFGYTLQGNWSVERSADLRRDADAVLASFKVQAPAQDTRLSRRLVGCWMHTSGTTDSSSYDRSTERWTFQPNGRYAVQRRSVASGDVGSVTGGGTQQGRWSTTSGRLMLQPDDDTPFGVQLGFEGGMILVGGKKYLPCQ